MEIPGVRRRMLYESLKLFKNERKYAVFKVLAEREEVTSKDIEQELKETREHIGFVDDTLRKLQELKLADRKEPTSPKTKEGIKARKSEFKEKYVCYRVTPYGQIVNRFLQAVESNTPWSEIQPNPQEILKLIEGMSSQEFKSYIEKFSGVYFVLSLLLGIDSQPEKTANTNILYHYLRGKLDPRHVNSVLKNYPNLVKVRPEPAARIDRVKTLIARTSRGRIIRYWYEPCKASYSLTSEGARVVEKLTKQGIGPHDLGMELDYVRRSYTRGELTKETVRTAIGGSLLAALGVFAFYTGLDLVVKSNMVGLLLAALGLSLLLGVISGCKNFYQYFRTYKQKNPRHARLTSN